MKNYEKKRMDDYLLKKSEEENMKFIRDKKREDFYKIKEALLFKNKLRMKQIEERQNNKEIYNKQVKEEKIKNLKMEEIKRNEKIKSF